MSNLSPPLAAAIYRKCLFWTGSNVFTAACTNASRGGEEAYSLTSRTNGLHASSYTLHLFASPLRGKAFAPHAAVRKREKSNLIPRHLENEIHIPLRLLLFAIAFVTPVSPFFPLLLPPRSPKKREEEELRPPHLANYDEDRREEGKGTRKKGKKVGRE